MTIDISEQERIIEALTKVTASQHDEIIRCHDRINDLLRSNNEFEARARNAERQLKAPEELAKLTEAGQELYCALTGGFEWAEGTPVAQAIHEYIEASNAYFDRLSKAS